MAKKIVKRKKIKIDKAAAAERIKYIYQVLSKAYPDARVSLNFKDALQLLVATILAAQCTDVRVNIVTKDLFKKYKNAKDYAAADLATLEDEIKSTGFYKNKAKGVKGAAAMILEKFNGKVPASMEELLELPSVGRKTANVILGNAYGIPGVITDTHVIRLSRRLGLSENYEDPVKLEFDLREIIPQKNWTIMSHLLVFHGRAICQARKPKCELCPIAQHCPAAFKPELW